MQEYLDARIEEIKILSNFEIEREHSFYEMSVYDFYFHLSVKSNQKINEENS
jgi:hypothetical protein